MKTTTAGRALLAALVCSSAQITMDNTYAQAPKAAPKAKPAPAAPQGPPGAVITTPKTVLGGGEEVEITFSAPMVADSMTGKAIPAASVLDIQPPLQADLVWRSSRSATLKVKSLVALGVNYRIALRRDVKDAAGKAAVPGPAVVASGPAFIIEQHQPRWFNTSGSDARQPVIYLYANDALNAATVAQAAFFRDKAGRTVTTNCAAVLVSEMGRYPQPFGAWPRRRSAIANATEPWCPSGPCCGGPFPRIFCEWGAVGSRSPRTHHHLGSMQNECSGDGVPVRPDAHPGTSGLLPCVRVS